MLTGFVIAQEKKVDYGSFDVLRRYVIKTTECDKGYVIQRRTCNLGIALRPAFRHQILSLFELGLIPQERRVRPTVHPISVKSRPAFVGEIEGSVEFVLLLVGVVETTTTLGGCCFVGVCLCTS